MAQEVAAVVRKQYAIPCDYFSVTGSDDPDDVPFDMGDDFLENHSFYNVNF